MVSDDMAYDMAEELFVLILVLMEYGLWRDDSE